MVQGKPACHHNRIDCVGCIAQIPIAAAGGVEGLEQPLDSGFAAQILDIGATLTQRIAEDAGVALLGLAGVPPLSGFWSKLLLFLSVANGPFGWLALAGILNSALSLGYYGWVVKRMYFDEGESQQKVTEPFWFVIVFAVLVGLIVGIGLFPQQAINFASGAVSNIRV